MQVSRRLFYILLMPLCLIATLALSSRHAAAVRKQKAASENRPNIVFINVDDLGWKDVGFMGNTHLHTPNIDRLAHQGMVFTAAYSNAPNCAPSRAALLTGQYPPRTGIYTVNSPERGKARFRKLVPIPNRRMLSHSTMTIAEALSQSGYVTASIGKWEFGDPPKHGPKSQGFDVNIGGYSAGNPGIFGGYFSPWSNPYLKETSSGTYLTNDLTNKASEFIKRNRAHPFFLYLPYYAVHGPWLASDKLVKSYKQREAGTDSEIDPTYGAMVENLDRDVGRILARLKTLGLSDKTIVIFTSDNGGDPRVTSMKPLRGSKGMLYEGGIRVPMAVRWPGVAKPGSITGTPVIDIDFFPTILQMASTPIPKSKVLDGKSLVPLLKGDKKALKDRSLFWHFPAYLQAYTKEQGRWRTTPAGAIRRGEWKLIEFFEHKRVELYNLKQDIGEANNLATQRPKKTQKMLNLLKKWRRSIGAPVPITPNPKYKPTSK